MRSPPPNKLPNASTARRRSIPNNHPTALPVNHTCHAFIITRKGAGKAQETLYSYSLDLQGPSDSRASDALDSLGKPADWRTAPTTWRPALGILPIDPAHLSLALFSYCMFSQRLTASLLDFMNRARVCGAPEDWKRWRKFSCKIRGTATGILARSSAAKGRTGYWT